MREGLSRKRFADVRYTIPIDIVFVFLLGVSIESRSAYRFPGHVTKVNHNQLEGRLDNMFCML